MPPFLTQAWFDEVKKLQADAPAPPAGMADLTLNIVVTGGPDGDAEVHVRGGQFEQGLVDDAPTKLTVPFDVAKAIFVENNQQAAMQAFMSGQIKVDGDMSKLMAMQGGAAPTPEATAFAEKIKEITD